MAKHKETNHGRLALLIALGLIVFGAIIALLLRGSDVALFAPRGQVASRQHWLLVTSVLVMLVFAVPVLILLYYTAWKYRETNTKAVYSPRTKHGKLFNAMLWALPSSIVVVLVTIMIPATHQLQPQKQITTGKKPITVQVVALRWKWLFIYPEQKIATVNFVQVPVNTPAQFELTADEAPMNSFWIPHLGGQLYAMTGHANRLNLIADTTGDYPGSAAEINGAGFAGMRFVTRVSSQKEFDEWVKETRTSTHILSAESYQQLLAPSENDPAAYFGSVEPGIYDTALSKYTGSHQHSTSTSNEGYQ
jgi:cytochrome o ubiquinol oxidase subunit 2